MQKILLSLLLVIAPHPIFAGEREVNIPGADGITLSGTFQVPEGKERSATVLLLPGSGPTDRNGNQQGRGSNLLKDIADRLGQCGIASLRFDKRGVGSSAALPGDPAKAQDFVRWSNYVGDVAAAYRFMRALPGVNPADTAVVGHSEGGMLAIAAIPQLKAAEQPAALVLVSTPGRPPDRVLRDQLEATMARQGVPQAQATAMLQENDRIVRSLRNDARLPDKVPRGLAALFPPLLVEFWDELLDFDPAAAIAGYRGPVLLLQGEADQLISADRDTRLLDSALGHRPGDRHRTVFVPGMDHQLRIRGKDGEPPVRSDAAINDICGWLKGELTSKSR